jgi:ketosteroid isomerase-like protein
MKKILIILLPAALMMAACSQPAATAEEAKPAFSLDSVKAAIIESNKKFSASVASGDSVGFLSCYTTDAVLMAPNAPKFIGEAGLKAYFYNGASSGALRIELNADEVFGGPEMVTEVGNWILKDSTGANLDKGNYMVLWKQENGQWKMFRDIYNSDNPPMPVAAPR